VPTYFTIILRDAAGVRRPEGGDTPGGAVTGANTATPTFTDLDNGAIRGTYTPTATGTDSLALTVNGTPIRNSPYISVVGATPVIVPNAMPFGFSNAHPYTYGPSTQLRITRSPSNFLATLAAASAAGAVVTLVYGRRAVRDSAGRFSLTNFRNLTDDFAALSGINAYIASGTFKYTEIIDDLTAEHWGGVMPSFADLSAAAAYIHSTYSNTVQTVLRKNADQIFGIQNLDYAHCQYVAWRDSHDGSGTTGVTAYRTVMERAATKIGCRIFFGLNTLDGGDGSSGVRGTKSPRWTMSPTEIRNYGRVLIASPMCDLFSIWKYDAVNFPTYFAPGSIYTAAFEDLSDLCSGEVR